MYKSICSLLIAVCLCVPGFKSQAQLYATVGTGTSSGSSDGPIYRSSASSSFDYCRYHYLYTQAELTAAGLLPGASLTDIAWYKTNNTQTNGPAHFEIWIKNSSLTSVQSAPQAFSTLTASATQVFSSNNVTFAPVAGWVNFTFNNAFIYTGGALEVTVAWDISGVSGSPTNGSFIWKRNSISNRTISFSGSTNGTTLNSNSSYRAQVRFTYESCLRPTNLTASNITINSADVSWTAPTGAIGYEYAATLTATPPASGTPTTATSGHVSGLMLNTTYYLHVRTKCSATDYSTWETTTFQTLDAYCKPPVNVLYSNLTSTGVDVLWSSMPTSDHYEYYLDVVPGIPAPTASLTGTPAITTSFGNLLPETKYYFSIRSICLGGNDSSTWRLDSFTTHKKCYAPDVQVHNAGATTADAVWYSIPTAIAYEYVVTATETAPAFGEETSDTVAQLVLDATAPKQYLHVRAKCNSQFSFSDWTTKLVIDNTTSVKETIQHQLPYIYPNPAKDYVTVRNAGGAVITITNAAGQILIKTTAGANDEKIDVRQLSPGVYRLSVLNDGYYNVYQLLKF